MRNKAAGAGQHLQVKVLTVDEKVSDLVEDVAVGLQHVGLHKEPQNQLQFSTNLVVCGVLDVAVAAL